MKNIQIIDGAANATYSIFQTTDEEFLIIFPARGQDLELVEDFVERVGEANARRILEPMWQRPIWKSEALGIHGTLFYDYKKRAHYLPSSRREADRDPRHITEAQRRMYSSKRQNADANPTRAEGPTHTQPRP